MRRLVILIATVLVPGAALACDGRSVDDPGVLAAPLCLPAAPQRIAVLDPGYSLGMAFELGLTVVAAPLTGMSDEALLARAQAAGVIDIGFVAEPSLETLVAAQPDLIIGAAFMAEPFYPVLSGIAPTALMTSANWRDYYASLATATGQEAALAGLFAPLDARIAALAPLIPDRTLSIVRITPWDFQVNLDGPVTYAPFALLQDLGVRRSAYETDDDPTSVKRPDWEDLALLDGDVLLYIIGGTNNSGDGPRWQEVSGNPLWQTIPAVAAGNVHPIDPAVWMEFSGIGSAHRVLDDVETHLIGSASGSE